MVRWRWQRKAWSSAPWGQERCLGSWLFSTTAPGQPLSRVSLHRHLKTFPHKSVLKCPHVAKVTQVDALNTQLQWNMQSHCRRLQVCCSRNVCLVLFLSYQKLPISSVSFRNTSAKCAARPGVRRMSRFTASCSFTCQSPSSERCTGGE